MRKIMLLTAGLAALALALPQGSSAQSFSLYGGYSFLHLQSTPSAANLNGWDVSLTDDFLPVLGLTADFSGNYGAINGVRGSALHTFLVGPELRFPAKISPFVRLMVGVAHANGGGNTIEGNVAHTTLSEDFGGGIDFRPMPVVGIRPFQIDYVTSHFNGQRQDNFRISAGITLRF